ncbi:flagellar export protein FliJ [Liquorilactobacillus vini]|uniref:Flagellar FliJ protein n=2 Tax=Liquorilactobacillus vini TaxID=238015 RepID=A0A0A7RH07_9LACO|nr:flagellar export protein FliJ [Liquorilactobacillus vini]AJA34500.1 flagellar FliJ protein [Liquorilactobacillus vini DSM 20605]
MRKFKFSLNKLLEFREQKEESVKEELLMAQKSLNVSEQQLHALEEEKKAAFNVSDFNVGKMQLQYHYILGLQQKIKETQAIVLKKQKVVNQVMSRMVEAQKDRKVLEKLQEKQHEQYLIDEKHQEQKIIDEIANRKKFSLF